MKKQTTPTPGTNTVAQLGGDLISTEVAQRLIADIRDGVYRDATQLPPEMELAVRLGVSRTVVRDALSELERKGHIERIRGIGTIINHGVAGVDRRMDQKLEFYSMIEAMGRQPHSDHLLVTKLEADAETAAELEIAVGQPVLRVCKRVLADDKPVLFSTDTVPLSLFEGQRLDSIDFSQPIFAILQQHCGIQTSSIVTHIHAVNGDAAVRRLLALTHDQALLALDELCYSRLCKPIIRCRTYYTDYFDFALVRKML